ncbi:MAG: hypothetical protein RSA49_04210 [Anaerovoracaceae bacterium]
MWKEQRLQINLGIPNTTMDGMPRTSSHPDEAGDNIANDIDIQSRIDALIEELMNRQKRIVEFIASIDDSMLRQIVNYRCLQLLSWNEVALKIGGKNTAESVRLIYHRAFD